MINLPRYRHQTLADVVHLLVEPMIRDRIAIAKENGAGPVGFPWRPDEATEKRRASHFRPRSHRWPPFVGRP
jgi:hypothetical protein